MSSLNNYLLALKLIGIGIIAAGVTHVLLGLNADQLLGANVSAQTLVDPGLDSQNRFYGAAFTLFGILMFVVARDIGKYKKILQCVLWVFFVAGMVRLISVVLYGWPPFLIILLFAIEIVVPPIMLVWLARLRFGSD